MIVMSHVVISVAFSNRVEILLNGASEMEMRVGLDRVTAGNVIWCILQANVLASISAVPQHKHGAWRCVQTTRGFVVDSVALGAASLYHYHSAVLHGPRREMINCNHG